MKNTAKMIGCIIMMSFVTICTISAYSLTDILDSSTISSLKKTGKLEKSSYNKTPVKFSLTPNTEFAKKAVQFWPNNKDAPVYVAEELYLINKEKLGSGDSNKTTIDYASKVIRSVSKMEGMQYYSHREKKVKTLYKECYCIKGPKDRTRIDDDTDGNAEGKVMYCMQDDNSFGKINYRLEYHQSEQEVSAGFVCTTPIYMGLVKAIEADNLRISVVITDCGDSMLVYMVVQANFPAIPVFESTMKESFSARLDAIYKWFVQQF
jgi:hypothetical protein